MNLPEHSGAQWGAAFRVAASEKWRKQSAAMGRHVTEAIVEFARVKPGMQVLDLASGTGEPAISVAELVGPQGRVVGIDLNAGLLEIAAQRARQRNLSNASFQQADVHALPFAADSFDLGTSRLGVMFFADIDRALSEARRVLKSGGRVAFLAWGPFEQPYFLSTIGVVRRFVSAHLSSQPEMFRFGEPGTLSAALKKAGFSDVQEQTRTVPWTWPGRPEEVWQYFREVTAPFRPLIESIPAEKVPEVNAAVHASVAQYFDGKQVNFTAEVVLAGATK